MMRSVRHQRLRDSIVRVALAVLGVAVLAAPVAFLIRLRPRVSVAVRTVTAQANPRLTPAAAAIRTVPTPLRPVPARVRVPTAARPDAPTGGLSRALGQMMVGRFAGVTPTRTFLRRIEAGQIGGVILFADNLVSGPAATRALTQQLQRAARQGGNPPLLIMTDQEGGDVRRLPGPPALSAGAMDTTAIAFAQGQATGQLLRSAGINVDLAPVADVTGPDGSFIGTRAFGNSPTVVASHACAFASGLASQGVAYTLKHFPGLGKAVTSTDNGPVSIDASAMELRNDYAAYLTCASNPRALVMVSSAIYPNLTGPLPAVMSPLTYQQELRIAVPRATVPTISDDLQAPALAGQASPARRAINAGLDLALYAQDEQGSALAYQALKTDLKRGQISIDRVRTAATAIAALKRNLARPA